MFLWCLWLEPAHWCIGRGEQTCWRGCPGLLWGLCWHCCSGDVFDWWRGDRRGELTTGSVPFVSSSLGLNALEPDLGSSRVQGLIPVCSLTCSSCKTTNQLPSQTNTSERWEWIELCIADNAFSVQIPAACSLAPVLFFWMMAHEYFRHWNPSRCFGLQSECSHRTALQLIHQPGQKHPTVGTAAPYGGALWCYLVYCWSPFMDVVLYSLSENAAQ